MKNIIIILFLVSSCQLLSQNVTELDLLLKNKSHSNHHHNHWNVAQNNNSTMEITLSSLFLFYKYFISSQDSQSCSFSLSCSVYAVETIKKQGFVLGIFDTFDRLMRCNGMSPEKYPHDLSIYKLIDPVRNVHYEEL